MSGSAASISTYATSTLSSNPLASRVRSLAQQGKPVVDISLKGEHGTRHNTYVTSFSTMDRLEGEVFITAPHDTRFDDIDIAFVGWSETYVDKFSTAPSMSTRSDAGHQFLNLRQPIDESTLPQPRIAEAGRTYRFPFTFVIPAQLLPKACQRYANDQVRAAHLQLPPSMGDNSISGHNGKLLDDLAPEMAKISYAIRVTVTRDRPDGSSRRVTLAEQSKKIRVKPAVEEQPPLVVGSKDSEYRLRQEKTVRKGVFKGKLGKLVVETQQPRSLRLPGARTPGNCPITTSARVFLRFDPADEGSLPPRLGSLSSKLRVSTFYATTPRRGFPSREQLMLDVSQGQYAESLSLSSRCMAGAQWQKHNSPGSSSSTSSPSVSRRDSGVSDCSEGSANTTTRNSNKNTPEPSDSYAGGTFYTSQLLIPVELPTNKTFVPTFHSCLISRVYRLDLSLSISATTSLSLKVPIQITDEGTREGAEERAERESWMVRREAEEGVDEMLAPRSVAPPAFEFLEGSRLGGSSSGMERRTAAATGAAPPGYEAAAFAGAQARPVETTIQVMG